LNRIIPFCQKIRTFGKLQQTGWQNMRGTELSENRKEHHKDTDRDGRHTALTNGGYDGLRQGSIFCHDRRFILVCLWANGKSNQKRRCDMDHIQHKPHKRPLKYANAYDANQKGRPCAAAKKQ